MRTELSEDGTPFNRLSRLAGTAMEAAKASPEWRDGDKIMVGIDRDEEDETGMSSGFGAHGYDGYADLFVALTEHAKAVIESSGKGTVTFERQPDGSFISRIEWAKSGKDAAAAMFARYAT